MSRVVHFALRRVSGLQHALSERLTRAGWLLLGVSVVTAAVGSDTTRATAFQAFALIAALLLIASAAAPLFRARVVVKRDLPRYATVGETLAYPVQIENRGRRALAGVQLRELLADPRPAYAEWHAAREPGEARRNAFDRAMGYHRWRWLIERRTPRMPAGTELPSLAPGERQTVTLSLVPRRRGRIELEGLVLARSDPLGLVNGLVRVASPGRVTALPRRYRLPRLALPGARRYQQGGVALAVSLGDSEEFVALRDYRPGDPLQRVHWKSFARSGKPVVKEHQDEFFERHALVLDTAAARGGTLAAFEEAVAIAASFVYAIDTHECLLDLLFVGEQLHSATAGRGQMKPEYLLEVLAGVEPAPPQGFELLANVVRSQRQRLSSCILVLLAWDEPRRSLVESLRRSGLEVRALLVCAREEAPGEAAGNAPAGLHVLHPGEVERGLALVAAQR